MSEIIFEKFSKPGSKELDAKIVTFLRKWHCIKYCCFLKFCSLMIEESMKFARQILFQVARYLINSNYSVAAESRRRSSTS